MAIIRQEDSNYTVQLTGKDLKDYLYKREQETKEQERKEQKEQERKQREFERMQEIEEREFQEAHKLQEIKEHIIDNIEYYEGTQADELHNELFNTDYYLIGYYNCEQWLFDNNINNTFRVIGYIKDYEQNNFGESYTDFTSSESVVNMYTYIIGEQIFNHINYNYDGELTKKDIKNIIKDIKEL